MNISNRKLHKIREIIRNALEEDIGSGDITSESIFDCAKGSGKFIAKESGIIAGLEVAQMTFELVDESVSFNSIVIDGTSIEVGKVIATVNGSTRALLTAERTALNFLQRMSGIATLTRKYADAVNEVNPECKVLDTRKTAPGLRSLDKWAVKLGCGENHRFGLFDMAMIKENHIHAAGNIENALQKIKENNPEIPIEVEVKNMDELQEAIAQNVDRIMLDNMAPSEAQKAVKLTTGRIPLEVSGNINLDTIKDYASTGVDFISVGRLTHSPKALDISFLLD
tara:strand:- start:1055 stop:1900 length:846 start_codon:yes stop_codon:yes gene_type:complete